MTERESCGVRREYGLWEILKNTNIQETRGGNTGNREDVTKARTHEAEGEHLRKQSGQLHKHFF